MKRHIIILLITFLCLPEFKQKLRRISNQILLQFNNNSHQMGEFE